METSQPLLTRSEAKTQLRYFSIYKKMPIIILVTLLVLSFIWGIVDPCVFQYYEYYGIMELSSGFWCWFIWMLIGGVVAVCTYFFLKVAYSHKLLQIYYLQMLAK